MNIISLFFKFTFGVIFYGVILTLISFLEKANLKLISLEDEDLSFERHDLFLDV